MGEQAVARWALSRISPEAALLLHVCMRLTSCLLLSLAFAAGDAWQWLLKQHWQASAVAWTWPMLLEGSG